MKIRRSEKCRRHMTEPPRAARIPNARPERSPHRHLGERRSAHKCSSCSTHRSPVTGAPLLSFGARPESAFRAMPTRAERRDRERRRFGATAENASEHRVGAFDPWTRVRDADQSTKEALCAIQADRAPMRVRVRAGRGIRRTRPPFGCPRRRSRIGSCPTRLCQTGRRGWNRRFRHSDLRRGP